MTLEQYSTEQLKVAAAAVMRAYLDYDAGHDTEPLRRYLASDAAATIDAPPPGADTTSRASVRAALGPYAVLRLDQHRAYVCAGVLQAGGEGTVLAVELVAADDRLHAVRVGRAAEATRLHQETTASETAAVATPRSGDLPPPVGDGQPPPEPPAHLRAMLGEFPAGHAACELWLFGAAIIEAFRDRHDLHQDSRALGGPTDNPEQQAERDRAAAYLREITRDLARLQPDRASESPARDAGREYGLGR